MTYKVFSNCVQSRLKSKAEETIGDYQGGFRPGRSTVDQIFILRQLFHKHGSSTKRYMFFLSTSKKRMIVYTEQA